MAYDIYRFPLLNISDDDSDATKLHKTCTALRQLYDTRDNSGSTEPDGCIGSASFGIAELKILLGRKRCQERYGYSSHDVEHHFQAASTARDGGNTISNTIHWATEIIVEFLYSDESRIAVRGRRGAEVMRSIQERLQQRTRKVYEVIEKECSEEREQQGHFSSVRLLSELFNAIKDHYERIPNSDAGIQEILTLGEEVAFVRLGTNTPDNVRDLHEIMIVKCRLPMRQFLDAAEQVIERQIMEQQHPMAAEYALQTLARAIPTLNPTVLQALPVEKWSNLCRQCFAVYA